MSHVTGMGDVLLWCVGTTNLPNFAVVRKEQQVALIPTRLNLQLLTSISTSGLVRCFTVKIVGPDALKSMTFKYGIDWICTEYG